MNIKPLVLAAFGCALLAGCRTDPNVPLLERELRMKEDEIYRLRDQLEDLQCVSQASARTPRPAPARPAERPASAPFWDRGDKAPPRDNAPEGAGPVAPPVVMPGEAVPPGHTPERLQVSPERSGEQGPNLPAVPPDSERLAPPSGDHAARTPAGDVRLASAVEVVPVDNAAVTRITLNGALSGGSRRAGLRVVVEPRDARGRILDAPGDVQLVAIDPALGGDAARIGNWELFAGETVRLLRPEPERGIQFNLPWLSRAPAHQQLQVFVRYTTRDGRRLETQGAVALGNGAAVADGWVHVDRPDRSSVVPAALRDREATTVAHPPPAALPLRSEPDPAERPLRASASRPVWAPER